jgi:hypothetical protein
MALRKLQIPTRYRKRKKMTQKILAIIGSLVVALGLFVYAQTHSNLVVAAATVTPAATTAAVTATTDATATGSATASATTVAEALAANQESHAGAADYVWDESTVIPITLNGTTILADDPSVIVEGSTATITAAGVYSLSGTLSDGQIVVDTEDEEVVRLILDGVDIYNSDNAPLAILQAEEVLIVLADGTVNNLSDGAAYTFAADEDEPNAALFSKADLTISGMGALNVTGNYNDAITSKDGLVIHSGTITVTSVDDGIRGKDYLIIEDGTITVDAAGDALKADNEEEADRGYIAVLGGTLNLTAIGDAMDAETDVLIAAGDITIVAGGGSNGLVGDDDSAKGIKGTVSVIIDGSNLEIDAADDAVHSNNAIVINNGQLLLATGDDAIHADATVTINGGDIRITDSYEGIESAVITINDGEIRLVASDDGINVSDGSGAGEMGPGMGGGMAPGMRSGGGAAPGAVAMPGQQVAAYTGSYYLYINGGLIVVNADGDGLDANGAIVMTGGVVLVDGPTNSGNGALDYDGGFNISGGLLVGTGSAGMAQAPAGSSSQNSLLVNFTATQPAGALVVIVDSAGENVLTYAPSKEYASLVFSSSALQVGETYTVYTGGSSSGTAADGLYEDGVYTPGTLYTEVTLTGVVTTYGASGRRR